MPSERGAKIYGELVGYAMNSDASDFVLPNPAQQARCMEMALQRGKLNASDIDLVSTHATATDSGDVQECIALRQGVSQRGAAGREQHEEFHRPRDGGGRGAGTGRQLAGV